MIHLLWASLLIPIVIHLVHRRKAKRVLFSTLRFLRMVDQRVARRQRLKELLLLALRLLLLAALIGALYRPMVRSATFKGGNVPAAVGLVLDNTYSMRAAQQGVMRFDRARKAAVEIVEGLKRGDAVSLALFDSPDQSPPDPTTGLSRLRDELSTLECGYGTAELAGALQRALRSLERSTNPRREIYVITDFQSLSWTTALTALGDGLPPDVPVFLVDVGGETAHNLALESAEFGLNVQVAGAASEMYCSLSNPGRRSAVGELSLFLDGEKVADQEVSLASGAEMSVGFSHLFDRTGDFWGEVRLGPDEVDADNARFFTVTVHDRLPVLLVNGDPSAVPYLDETFYLELALRAPAAGGKIVSPIEPRVVAAAEFLEQRLDDYACVILANVPRLDDLWAERLRRYVLAGGGLILFVGDRVDPASYNTALGGSEDPLLPALLGAPRRPAEADGAFRIRGVDEQHPLFRGLIDQIDLSAARVTQCLAATVEQGEGVGVLARLDGGPLLLDRKAGPGAVILCTSSADLDWNNMAVRSFFLPVLHQMVYHVGRSGHRGESVPVGMPYLLELPKSSEPVEVSFYAVSDEDRNADAEPLSVVTAEPAGGGQRAVFTQTARPGAYRAVYAIDGTQRTRLFAVNTEPRESSADRIDPEDAARLLGKATVRIVREPGEVALVARRERSGLPLWDYLFALALVAAVVETYVGNVLLKH